MSGQSSECTPEALVGFSGTDFDYVLVGAGLHNALTFLALHAHRPGLRVGLIESGERVGGNHTWCFHSQDLSAESAAFVAPTVDVRWPGYRIEFPELSRRLDSPYACVTSRSLDAVVRAVDERWSGSRLMLSTRASSLDGSGVVLDDGTRLTARVVIDARGPERLRSSGAAPPGRRYAYQKFLGIEMDLEHDVPFDAPLLMDARVPQTDGFRFVYVLPLTRRRLLIEDTYYSESPDLDTSCPRAEVLAYAARCHCRVADIVREETGVLPIPLTRIDEPSVDAPLVAGYAGGWFHPTTGYSFPLAARWAALIATHDDQAAPNDALRRAVAQHKAQARFCLLLNRMLFGAFPPDQRRNVLERFYRLPEPTIARFYAMTMTTADRARIICGRPPRGFSLKRAIQGGALA